MSEFLIGCCLQRSGTNERAVTASGDSTATATPAAATAKEDGGMVVAGKPFYPEVEVCHVETPSKFYVLELSRKDALAT